MIVETTNNLVELVRAAFPKQIVKEVSKLPGRISEEMLTRFLVLQPAVYFTFIGGRGKGDTSLARLNASWACYIVSNIDEHPSSISIDQILDVLVPLIHNYDMPDIGTFSCTEITNVYSQKFDKSGAKVTAITFTLPNFTFNYEPDLTALNDFVTLHAEHSIAEGSDEPDAIDHITLEQ